MSQKDVFAVTTVAPEGLIDVTYVVTESDARARHLTLMEKRGHEIAAAISLTQMREGVVVMEAALSGDLPGVVRDPLVID